MDAILNLGDPSKDIGRIAAQLMPQPEQRKLKITGARLFLSEDLLLTSPLYGAGMVQDCLAELWAEHTLLPDNRMVLLGSMGSLTSRISLDQAVLPNPVLCAYYGFRGREVWQDQSLMSFLSDALRKEGHPAVAYRHGSSYAVFDPHTDHQAYRTSLYDDRVWGLDCGEVYMGMEFAREKNIRVAAVLYCSDSPERRIGDLSQAEFAARAARYDLLLNAIACGVLRNGGPPNLRSSG